MHIYANMSILNALIKCSIDCPSMCNWSINVQCPQCLPQCMLYEIGFDLMKWNIEGSSSRSMYFLWQMNNCLICYKKVLQHDKTSYCSCCCKYIHRNCSGLLNAQYEYVKSDTSWYCKKCIGEMFPFNHRDDECILLKATSEISTSSDIMIRHHTESKIFNPLEINEDGSNILEYQYELDPYTCFLNHHLNSLLEACNYQTE